MIKKTLIRLKLYTICKYILRIIGTNRHLLSSLYRLIISKIRVILISKKSRLRERLINLKDSLGEAGVFSTTFSKILVFLEEGSIEKVVNFLQKKYKFSIYPSISLLKKLYQYAKWIEKKDLPLWDMKKAGEKVIIHFCCWNVSYTEKVKKYLIPSLLAENNLPALSLKYNVVLMIHCDDFTKKAIVKSDFYGRLVKYATIHFFVFPSKLISLYYLCAKPHTSIKIFPTVRYLLLGVCQTHAFKIALKNQAYISFLMPDVVLSDSFMSYAFEKIINKKIILTTTYRTNYSSVITDLNKYYLDQAEKQKLVISATQLVDLQIKHIHDNEQKRVVSTKTENFSPMARLLFKDKKGFVLRCFHYHPVLINCKNIFQLVKLDYLPIDNTALNCVLDANVSYPDQTWVCDDACQMAIMEMSGEAPETDAIINRKTLSYGELIVQVRNLIQASPKIYNSPFNRFLVSHRHRFVSKNFELEDVDDIIDDVSFFEEIYKSM